MLGDPHCAALGILQGCERPLEDTGLPLMIAGVENMGPLVAAMTREWEVAMHNATVAAIPKPAPPPGEPSTGAVQREGAVDDAGTAGKEKEVAVEVEAEEPKVGDVVMGEVEVVDLAAVEEKPTQTDVPGT